VALSDSKIESIQSHFQALSEVALTLNSVSDELTKAVGLLDEALKKLNVGLTVWVNICHRGVEDHEFDDDELGYAKVQGKWGLALRRVWGNEISDAYNEDGPWLFNDAPRELRFRSVDCFVNLIKKLHEEASTTVKKVEEKTKQVHELAVAISEAEESNKKTTCVGILQSQVREIRGAIQSQQKFLGELIEHSHKWELVNGELKLWFSAEKRPFAEMVEGRDSLTRVVQAARKVLGRPVKVTASIELPVIKSEELGRVSK